MWDVSIRDYVHACECPEINGEGKIKFRDESESESRIDSREAGALQPVDLVDDRRSKRNVRTIITLKLLAQRHVET